jgi:diaminopimelate epimerase
LCYTITLKCNYTFINTKEQGFCDDRQSDRVFPKNDIQLIAHLCDRRLGLVVMDLFYLKMIWGDFKMVYYNSDGNQSTMCGNGGRCLVALPKLNVIDTKAV